MKTVLIIFFAFLTSCDKEREIKSQIILEKETMDSKQTFLATDGRHINALDLIIKGEITGSGQLSIGDNDSTFYKTYEVIEGKIEIKYEGDWYSRFCYVTYKPTTVTTGQIEIQGDFKGD